MTLRNKKAATRGAHVARRRGARLAMVLVVVIVGAVAGYLVYRVTQLGTGPSDQDGGDAVVLPQNPSLKMLLEDGAWSVENDGNVTMAEVEVRDTAGEVICAIGTMSPGDLEPCEEAGDRQELVAFGSGPQGQKVEAPSG